MAMVNGDPRMNEIFQDIEPPRLVWHNTHPILDQNEMSRLINILGEEFVGEPPSEPVIAGLNDPLEALAAFRLAFPAQSFYGVGPDFDPPFAAIDITEEIVN